MDGEGSCRLATVLDSRRVAVGAKAAGTAAKFPPTNQPQAVVPTAFIMGDEQLIRMVIWADHLGDVEKLLVVAVVIFVEPHLAASSNSIYNALDDDVRDGRRHRVVQCCRASRRQITFPRICDKPEKHNASSDTFLLDILSSAVRENNVHFYSNKAIVTTWTELSYYTPLYLVCQ